MCFSGIGFSHHIFALVARDGSEIFQVLSGCVSLLALLLYIVLDIGKASNKIWLPYALLSFATWSKTFQIMHTVFVCFCSFHPMPWVSYILYVVHNYSRF